MKQDEFVLLHCVLQYVLQIDMTADLTSTLYQAARNKTKQVCSVAACVAVCIAHTKWPQIWIFRHCTRLRKMKQGEFVLLHWVLQCVLYCVSQIENNYKSDFADTVPGSAEQNKTILFCCMVCCSMRCTKKMSADLTFQTLYQAPWIQTRRVCSQAPVSRAVGARCW